MGFCTNSRLSAVTKFILATKAAFSRKILCFEEFKILFGHLVDRTLENKSLQEHEARKTLEARVFGTGNAGLLPLKQLSYLIIQLEFNPLLQLFP